MTAFSTFYCDRTAIDVHPAPRGHWVVCTYEGASPWSDASPDDVWVYPVLGWTSHGPLYWNGEALTVADDFDRDFNHVFTDDEIATQPPVVQRRRAYMASGDEADLYRREAEA